MGYRQLTQEQRYQISALLVAGKSQRQIATLLGCHSSTISRELRRNGTSQGYQADRAHRSSEQRRSLATKAHKQVYTLIDWVSSLIRKRWSPDQIAGVMARLESLRVSRQWIYDLIHRDRIKGGTLWTYGRQPRRRRCQRSLAKRAGLGKIPNRTGIEHRPRRLISEVTWGTGKATRSCTAISSRALPHWWSVGAATCWQAS